MDNTHDRDRAEEVALFRFSVICEAVSPRLTPAERGLMVRALAARTWTTPEGVERCFARVTIDRWVVAYRRDGLGDCGRHHAPIGAGPVPKAAGWKKRR
jgi:putative transposase